MNITKNKKILYRHIIFVFLFFYFFIFLFSTNFCSAALLDNITCAGKGGETCELNEFAQVAVNVSKWILGIVGSLALLMFIYGGLMIMLAGGTTITGTEKTTKVNKGKDAIRNAIVGLIIVFTSYMIIMFTAKALGIDINILKSGWFKP